MVAPQAHCVARPSENRQYRFCQRSDQRSEATTRALPGRRQTRALEAAPRPEPTRHPFPFIYLIYLASSRPTLDRQADHSEGPFATANANRADADAHVDARRRTHAGRRTRTQDAAMAAMEAANAHYHNGHQQSGLPASPTLTNPDMILPDYDRSDSPEASLDGPDHASLMMWKNTHNNPSGAGVGPDMHNMFVATGMAGPRPYGPSGPMTPTTPIIYGNGTMLSDIGEVTEVESTVGKPSPGRARSSFKRQVSPRFGSSGNDTGLQSSPTINAASSIKKKSKQSLKGKQQQHERRSSIESTSTVTNGEHVAAFADFDDSVSVGDSVFQGDDEESMASSYVDGTAAMEPGRLGVTKVDSADRLSTYSTTSISRRAEEILANAKKRLTVGLWFCSCRSIQWRSVVVAN